LSTSVWLAVRARPESNRIEDEDEELNFQSS
jgi:hypothetical protein